MGGSGQNAPDFVVDFESKRIGSHALIDLWWITDVKPSDDEMGLYNQVESVLEKSSVILDKLLKYCGCEEFIRKVQYIICVFDIFKAITTPGPETEEAAWNGMSISKVWDILSTYEYVTEYEMFLAVLPAVDQLQEFFDYAMELETWFPKLLSALCKDTSGKNTLQNQQALAKQLASIFDFVLRFDDAKVWFHKLNSSNQF